MSRCALVTGQSAPELTKIGSFFKKLTISHHSEWRGGLRVSALDSGSSGSGSGHCVVFLGKGLLSPCLSAPRYIDSTGAFTAGGLPRDGLESFSLCYRIMLQTPG